MNFFNAAAFFVVALSLSSTSNAQAFRCAGKDGRISFQQNPCNQDQVQKELDVKKPKILSSEEERILKATASGKVTRGMTAAQLRSSWGSPTKINRSVGSYGSHEQWVYDRGNFKSQYVYLENDIVTSFQSSD